MFDVVALKLPLSLCGPQPWIQQESRVATQENLTIQSATRLLDFTQIQLMGQITIWLVAVLLAVFFSQLPRFGAHRELLPVWVAAWLALAVATTGPALEAFGLLNGTYAPLWVRSITALVVSPGRMLFIVLVSLAAVGATGRRVRPALFRALMLGALALGVITAGIDSFDLRKTIVFLALPVLFFGTGQLVLFAAKGHRIKAMYFLSASFIIFALVMLLLQVADTNTFHNIVGSSTARFLVASREFWMAAMLALLGSAVVVLVVQDSTHLAAQAQSERLLEIGNSERRLKQIIEAAGEAIVTFGFERRIELSNAAALRLFGVDREVLSGRRLDDLIVVSDAVWPVGRADLDSVATTHVAIGKRAGGGNFPAEFTIGPLLRDGVATGGVAIVRDLTSQRAERIERERFEHQVAETEKMLAIGRVVSGVAHELNNPLAVVLGQSEQLAVDLPGGDLADGIELIHEQAERARHIVRDLLTFVRPEGVRDGELVDLPKLVARIVDVQSPRAAGGGVELELRSSADSAVVSAERLSLEQVVTNLVENAVDAAGSGGTVSVEVTLAGHEARIVVEDSGSGIAEANLERIFEPFFTTKGVGRGTGLGLSVSLGLVERQGGRLEVANRPEPGVGARFTVAMPLVEKPELISAPGPDARPHAAPVRDAVTGQELPVLIVDDEPAVRKTMAKVFERWGWRVQLAESGVEALEILEAATSTELPGVIVCDLRMPGMGGEELFDALSDRSPEMAARLLFATGDVVEPSAAEFLARSAQPVVEKPFTMAELAAAVRRLTETVPLG